MKKIVLIWLAYEAYAYQYNLAETKKANSVSKALVEKSKLNAPQAPEGVALPNNVYYDKNNYIAKPLPSLFKLLALS